MAVFLFDGSNTAARVATFLSIVAATWTVGYMVGRQTSMLRAAYDLGRQHREADLVQMADRR